MTTHLDPLRAFIPHHPGLAYGAIFLISLSESLALAGLLVPGTVTMFGVGGGVAEMLGVRPARFRVVNVLSAVGWALVYILPGGVTMSWVSDLALPSRAGCRH